MITPPMRQLAIAQIGNEQRILQLLGVEPLCRLGHRFGQELRQGFGHRQRGGRRGLIPRSARRTVRAMRRHADMR